MPAAEVEAAYGELGEGLVAVRSSACAEDSEAASFAGQQETYLNVFGGAEVSRRVADCWASFFSERALFYRAKKGSLEDLGMAVVVQRMVEPAKSGVMFTVDPVQRRRDRMLVEAVFGLGEQVVSGHVTPDHYVVDRAGRVKRERLVNGGVLDPDDLARLAELGAVLERAFWRPPGCRVGDRRGGVVPIAVPSRDDVVTREERAREWIDPYWNRDHLVRTLDWLLDLDPDAPEALRLAALTHDMERHFPPSRSLDLSLSPEENVEYNRWHSERSARIVGDWLRDEGAGEELVGEVRRLILAHEYGGEPDEDLLQAADSISFLEVNAPVLAGWYADGRCSRKRAKAQARWMFERIKLERGRELARPHYEEALAVVDRA